MLRVAVIASLMMTGAVHAAPGRCLLRVEGTTYLEGTCNVMVRADGGFSIGMVESETDRLPAYFATVNNDDGKMRGFWNAQKGATHAQTDLGTLRRNGGCWENPQASICAWR